MVFSFTELPGMGRDLRDSRSFTGTFDVPDDITLDRVAWVKVGLDTAGLAFNSELCNINKVQELCMDDLVWIDGGKRWEIFDRTNNAGTVRTYRGWDRGQRKEWATYSNDREKTAALDGRVTMRVDPSEDETYEVHELRIEIWVIQPSE
ncbi:MAG: hypothetical protein AAFX05_09430 [Planctomycetota bacterium]